MYDEIVFTGSAMDFRDGELEGDSLVWTSNIDDEIGTGTIFTESYLSVGTHTITLTATNSRSEKWTASVTMTIIPDQPDQCLSNGTGCMALSGGEEYCCSGCCCYFWTEVTGTCEDGLKCGGTYKCWW